MFDLELFLPYRLYQATESSSQSFREVYQTRFGITRAEWRVLFNVGQYGPISAQEIVERTYLDKTKISRAVQKLVERKWLKRSSDLADRRRQALELTARGRKLVDELSAHAEQHNQAIIAVIGQRKFEDLLKTLEEIEKAKFDQTAAEKKTG